MINIKFDTEEDHLLALIMSIVQVHFRVDEKGVAFPFQFRRKELIRRGGYNNYTKVSNTLQRLKKKGFIFYTSKGVWELTERTIRMFNYEIQKQKNKQG